MSQALTEDQRITLNGLIDEVLRRDCPDFSQRYQLLTDVYKYVEALRDVSYMQGSRQSKFLDEYHPTYKAPACSAASEPLCFGDGGEPK